MRENDEITGLFRSRLAGAEMTVREDFWEGCNVTCRHRLPQKAGAAFSFSEVSPRSRSRLCCICTGSCFCRFLVFLSERGNQGGLYTSGGHDAGR